MARSSSLFQTLLAPLAPTNNAPVATPPRRRKAAVPSKTIQEDSLWTPSPSNSRLVARPKGKSKLRPDVATTSPEVTPKRTKQTNAPRPKAASPPRTTAAKPQGRSESLESVVPDSEQERARPRSPPKSAETSDSELDDPIVPPSTARRLRHRRIISSDDDTEDEVKTDRPTKALPIHHSSDDDAETVEDSIQRGKDIITAIVPAQPQPQEVIVITDSEDEVEVIMKAHRVSRSPQRRSSVRSLSLKLVESKTPTEEAGEVIPSSQPELDEWSDAGGELGYVLPKSPRKPFSPTASANGFEGFRRKMFPRVPAHDPESSKVREVPAKASRPTEQADSDEVMETSPRKVPAEFRPVRSMVNDEEVIEILSDTDPDEDNFVGQPSSPAKAMPIPKLLSKEISLDRMATPPNPKPKRIRGPVTPTSPSGKAMTKAAKARLLEHQAQELFDDLNDNVFDGILTGCELTWSKLLSSTAGKAYLRKPKNFGDSQGAPKHYAMKIELSTKVVDSEERVRNTLSHEMCHLSTWIVDGVGNPDHGEAWKKWARRVTRYRPDIEISTRHTYEISYKYSWQCTNDACGHVYGRFSKSIDITKQGCGICRSVLKPLFETKTKTSAWQEFVKENMKTVKKDNPGISQAATMQLLAEMWKKSKDDMGTETVDDLVAGMGRLLM